MLVRQRCSLSRSICDLHLPQQEHTNVGTRSRSSKPAGNRRKAVVDRHRTAVAAVGSLRPSDRAGDGSDGRRERWIRSRALGHARALAGCRRSCSQLVWRQSRRHARARAQGRAAEVRLLPRSRRRHRRRHAALRWAGSIDVHVARGCSVAARGVSACFWRSVPRDRGQRRVQDVVRRRRPDRTADSAGRRDHRVAHRSARRFRRPRSYAVVRLRGPHRDWRPRFHALDFGDAECGCACAAGAAPIRRCRSGFAQIGAR